MPDPPDIHTTAGKIADLERRLDEAVHAGSAAAVEKQHAKGKMTARERVLAAARRGLVRGVRRVRQAPVHELRAGEASGRTATAWSPATARSTGARSACSRQDVTVFGGSLGEVYGEKIVKVLDLALKTGCPIIGINEGGGARIQEGVVALGLYARDLQTQRARLRA